MIKLNFEFFAEKISDLGEQKKMTFKDEIPNELRSAILFEYFIEQKFTSQLDFAKLAIWHWAVGISTIHYNLMIYINYFFVIPFF